MTDPLENNPDLERPRGILTKRDRQLLLDDEPRMETRTQRNRLRERVKNSLKDIHLLTLALHPEDRRQIFEDVAMSEPDVIQNAFGFFYLGNRDVAEDIGQNSDEMFENLMVSAIHSAEREQGLLKDTELGFSLDISLQFESEDIDKTTDEIVDVILERGWGTTGQLNYLLREGETEPILNHIIETDEPFEFYANAQRREGEAYKLSPREAEILQLHHGLSEEE